MIEPQRAPNLPRVHPAVWHGAIGAAVRAIAPMTEADPVAVLASTLALFGAICGDASFVRVGGVRHPARVWPLIIGKTGAGRKGTSWAEARALGRAWSSYSEYYDRKRILSGLASGEGLIGNLGGATLGEDKKDGPGKDDGPDKKEAAAPDGRLMVVETEFARVLSVSKRDGSTLGPILRQLWDDGSAASLTRQNPMAVDNAHLGMVAHITPRELRLRLAESDLAGGTLNRYLLIGSERPHLLPHEPPHPDVTAEAEWLGKAAERARFGHELRRDRAADELWPDVYAALNASEPDGQLGSVLARGPAYTMRLALTYALADGAGAIGCEHLLAALALWQYAAATARMVFPEGKAQEAGDRIAGYISVAAGGRTRTEITTFCARNVTAADLTAILDDLERHGQVQVTRDEPTGGRPAVRYRWIGTDRDPMTALLRRYEVTN